MQIWELGGRQHDLAAHRTSRLTMALSSIALSLILLLGLCPSSRAMTLTTQITAIKLLTAQVGWAMTRVGHKTHLVWTTNGGRDWKDITPQLPSPRSDSQGQPRVELISSAFFLNTKLGWVLFSYYDQPQSQFNLASTTNSGRTWTIMPVAIPHWDRKQAPVRAAVDLKFADPAHGWLVLARESGPLFRFGELLVTSDGGRSWKPAANDPGIQGLVALASPSVGFLAGGPADEDLYITRDGARSWRKVTLDAPKEVGSPTWTTYDVPIFLDSKHGFVAVTYSHAGSKSAAVLFETRDGGFSWKADRMLTNLPETTGGGKVASTIADSTWIVALATTKKPPASPLLIKLPSGETIRASDEIASGHITSAPLSFVSQLRGWVVGPRGRLHSTDDGGATWKIGPQATQPRTQTFQRTVSLALERSDSAPAESTPASSTSSAVLPLGVGGHVGFDRYPVITEPDMRLWWSNSPYADVGFYIPGGFKINTGAVATWVSAVYGQGWSLMPIWSDEQAPCYCPSGNCAAPTFGSADNDQADSDGIQEAISAAFNATQDGLQGTIIYYDLEYYDNTDSSCKAAVQQFLGAWIPSIKAAGFKAGIYGSPIDAPDWASLTVPPDDIWMGTYNPNADLVTIWNLNGSGYSLNDGEWGYHERIRQYQNNRKETWGGAAYNIDPDVEDAETVAGNGTKTYTYTPSYFSCSNCSYPVYRLYPNAVSNGGPGGQTGQIVGSYLDTLNGYQHAIYGYDSLSIRDFDCGDGTATVLNGINNLGMSVGFYFTNGTSHGFQFDTVTGGGCYTLDYPGAAMTFLYGINDA